jgi:hypothetical protein
MKLKISADGKVREIDLADGQYVVGRAPECDIRIRHDKVSRHHASLRVEGEQLFVRDMGSTHGTDVDGVPVGGEERAVPPSTILHVADVELWREEFPRVDSPPRMLFSQDSQLATRRYQISEVNLTGTARDRIGKMFSGFLALMASRGDPESLETEACEFVSRWVKAERVVLLGDHGPGTPLTPRARWIHGKDPGDRLRLSSSILDLVHRDRHSVLIEDATADPRTRLQDTVVALGLRTAMAAPLFDHERVRGILYVDSTSPHVRYRAEDLQVLTVTAQAVAVKLSNHWYEHELRLAAHLQRGMLPRALHVHPGYEMAAHHVMCLAVGGDLYQVLPRPDGTVLLALGDVAGKGMPAALAMGTAVGLLRLLAEVGGPLRELTTLLHRHLYRALRGERFLTLFLGELEPESGRLSYVNHGQDYPIVVRANGAVERLEATGVPLALLESIEVTPCEAHLNPGDLLAVFSDGISEATTGGADFFDVERLEPILRDLHDQPLDRVCARVRDAIDAFLGGSAPGDDVTLILLRRKATEPTG